MMFWNLLFPSILCYWVLQEHSGDTVPTLLCPQEWVLIFIFLFCTQGSWGVAEWKRAERRSQSDDLVSGAGVRISVFCLLRVLCMVAGFPGAAVHLFLKRTLRGRWVLMNMIFQMFWSVSQSKCVEKFVVGQLLELLWLYCFLTSERNLSWTCSMNLQALRRNEVFKTKDPQGPYVSGLCITFQGLPGSCRRPQMLDCVAVTRMHGCHVLAGVCMPSCRGQLKALVLFMIWRAL